MNKVYKVIWNKAKRCLSAVSELVRSHTKGANSTSSRASETSRPAHFRARLSRLTMALGVGLGLVCVMPNVSAYTIKNNGSFTVYENITDGTSNGEVTIQNSTVSGGSDIVYTIDGYTMYEECYVPYGIHGGYSYDFSSSKITSSKDVSGNQVTISHSTIGLDQSVDVYICTNCYEDDYFYLHYDDPSYYLSDSSYNWEKSSTYYGIGSISGGYAYAYSWNGVSGIGDVEDNAVSISDSTIALTSTYDYPSVIGAIFGGFASYG